MAESENLAKRLREFPSMSVVGSSRALIDRYKQERLEAAAALDAKDAEIERLRDRLASAEDALRHAIAFLDGTVARAYFAQ